MLWFGAVVRNDGGLVLGSLVRTFFRGGMSHDRESRAVFCWGCMFVHERENFELFLKPIRTVLVSLSLDGNQFQLDLCLHLGLFRFSLSQNNHARMDKA